MRDDVYEMMAWMAGQSTSIIKGPPPFQIARVPARHPLVCWTLHNNDGIELRCMWRMGKTTDGVFVVLIGWRKAPDGGTTSPGG